MTVGTFIDPDFETQLGTQYKTAIDNSLRVGKRIVDAFAPHEHASFGMQVSIDAGYIFDGVTLTEIAAQAISSIPAPSINPRIDRIVIDQLTGLVSRVAGSESASPVPPAIPSGKIPCCRVALSVGQTNIINANITDERLGGGGVIATKEATFAVSVNTGESANSLTRMYVVTNTTSQIVVRISITGVTGGAEPSTTVVDADFTVTHNLGLIQLVTPSLVITSLSNPFTGTLKVHYR